MNPMTELIKTLPVQFRGDYVGFLCVIAQNDSESASTPEFRFYSPNRQGDLLTLEDIQNAIFVAGVHENNTSCTIIKDSVNTLGAVEFDDAMKRAYRAIEDWSGSNVSLALNNKTLWEDAMTNLIPVKVSGSGVLKEYFGQSPTLRTMENMAFPFIVFESTDEEVIIHVITKTQALFDWPNNTKVMGQWPKYMNNTLVRVEWMNFMVKDLHNFMRSRGVSDEHLGTDKFTINS